MEPFLSSQKELCRLRIGLRTGFSHEDELLRCSIWFRICVFRICTVRSPRSDFSRRSMGACCCCWYLCCKSLSHSDFCRDTFELFVFERNKSRTAFLMKEGFLDSFFLVLGENVSSGSTLEFMASEELRKPITKNPT